MSPTAVFSTSSLRPAPPPATHAAHLHLTAAPAHSPTTAPFPPAHPQSTTPIPRATNGASTTRPHTHAATTQPTPRLRQLPPPAAAAIAAGPPGARRPARGLGANQATIAAPSPPGVGGHLHRRWPPPALCRAAPIRCCHPQTTHPGAPTTHTPPRTISREPRSRAGPSPAGPPRRRPPRPCSPLPQATASSSSSTASLPTTSTHTPATHACHPTLQTRTGPTAAPTPASLPPTLCRHFPSSSPGWAASSSSPGSTSTSATPLADTAPGAPRPGPRGPRPPPPSATTAAACCWGCHPPPASASPRISAPATATARMMADHQHPA